MGNYLSRQSGRRVQSIRLAAHAKGSDALGCYVSGRLLTRTPTQDYPNNTRVEP